MNTIWPVCPTENYGGAAVTGTAPTNSPSAVSGVTLTAGAILTFGVNRLGRRRPGNINQNWTPMASPRHPHQ